MGEPTSELPSESEPAIYTMVRNLVNQRLDEYSAWPYNIFKCECEKHDIYQDFTHAALKELEDNDEIKKIKEQRDPYFTRPTDTTSKPDEEIKDAVYELNDFLNNYAFFAELTAYVAFCKIHDEIGDKIRGMDVLPKSPRPHQLHGTSNVLDGFINLPTEYIPVEVYNGRKFLGLGGKKEKQICDLSAKGPPMANPFLINRRSDDEVKKLVRSKHGMVVDTDIIIGCRDAKPDLPDVLDLLELDEIVHLLPAIETEDKEILGGDYYHKIATNGEMGDILRPPSKMVPAADTLPEDYINRIRGGVQLLYVNSFYRRANNRTEQEASLVLQDIYNELLREGGHDMQTALNKGWANVTDKYTRIKNLQQRKNTILDQTKTFLSELRQQRVIVERNGELHARRAEHPQQSLSFYSS